VEPQAERIRALYIDALGQAERLDRAVSA
jgi:hypothetical protein